jgi:Bacterial conjugation TrbI-like protein
MIGTRTAPFGTPATRLHAGRIALVALLLVGSGVAGWIWLFHRWPASGKGVTESGTSAPWTAAQMQYEKPEVKVEPLLPTPQDTIGPQIAKIFAMLQAMDGRMTGFEGRLTALENRKPPPPPTPRPEPVKKAPAPLLFIHHDVKEGPPLPKLSEYTLAPGSTKIPCVLETAVNSDVEGYLVSKVSTNVYDSATGRHLLIPQGSSILGHDQSQQLLYGNERLDTISLTLALPDGRSVDLGKAPITDQQGVAGLTGDVNNHWGRLFGAVFIGGALRGGTQAIQVALAQEGGAGQVAAGIAATTNQALSPRVGRALDTRPTITIAAGQLCHVLLIRPLSLPAMWQ